MKTVHSILYITAGNANVRIVRNLGGIRECVEGTCSSLISRGKLFGDVTIDTEVDHIHISVECGHLVIEIC